MKYTHFLLDADETVFDFVSAARKSFKYTLEQFSLPFTEEKFLRFKAINDDLWREYERGAVSKAQLRVMRFERFFAETGICGDAEKVDGMYFDTLCNAGDLLNGAKQFLKELKERGKVYMITNGTTAAQKGRIRASGIGEFLDGVFISDELGVAKPEKAFFEAVLKSIGISGKNCVVIGDSLTSDISGANNAGLDCIWFNPQGKKAEGKAFPDHIAYTYKEIIDIIDCF